MQSGDADQEPLGEIVWDSDVNNDPVAPAEDLEDNTYDKRWHPFYIWRGESPRKAGTDRAKWPLFIAVTREITEPWRCGRGLGFRYGQRQAAAVGIWTRGKSPSTEEKPLPLEETIQRSTELDELNRSTFEVISLPWMVDPDDLNPFDRTQ